MAEGGGSGRGRWSGEGVPGETGRGRGRVGGKRERGVETGVEAREGEEAEGLVVGEGGDGSWGVEDGAYGRVLGGILVHR